eukprot:scaffold111515_cov61-Phaeocystis_antarctica.AAC.4
MDDDDGDGDDNGIGMPPLCNDNGNGDGDGDGDGDGEGEALLPPPEPPGRLRPDHAIRCGCGCGGISAASRRRAAPPRTRPSTPAYRPDETLESFLLPRGNDPRCFLDAALAEAEAAEPDDQMVLEGGHGPERVHLLANKHYPSCERFATALCTDGNLATYGHGEYQSPENEAMRPMSKTLYELGVAEWRRAWPWLSPESQRCPPDLCMAQRYDAWRGERGAFMGFHTDMRTLREGQVAASCGDVIGVSTGSSMNFWFGASSGAEVAAERRAVLLRDGDTWVWKHGDDLSHKQGGMVKM